MLSTHVYKQFGFDCLIWSGHHNKMYLIHCNKMCVCVHTVCQIICAVWFVSNGNMLRQLGYSIKFLGLLGECTFELVVWACQLCIHATCYHVGLHNTCLQWYNLLRANEFAPVLWMSSINPFLTLYIPENLLWIDAVFS